MQKILKIFKQISNIPRESGNEKGVANFLVEFAKKRNLYFYKDELNNVLIKKNSNKKPIILHSHTDMVCVKEKDFDFDFSKQPINLIKNKDFLKSFKTSLGADNGIGVALILSLLDDKNDFNIEALFTTREETDMKGAIDFDFSKLSSKKMISLDGLSEEELINGCASICDMKIKTNIKKTLCLNKKGFQLCVSGLKGGHSGNEIDKNTGNAFFIALDVLNKIDDIKISCFEGGNQFNFIPNSCLVSFACKNSFEDLQKIIFNIEKRFVVAYPNLKIIIKQKKINEIINNSNSLIEFLNRLKQGVIYKKNNQILLSQNVASVDTKNDLIKISQRGHNLDLEEKNINDLIFLADSCGFKLEIFDKQKGFETKKSSYLIKSLDNIKNKLFKNHFKIVSKHISLEAAIFVQKIKNLDVVIVSPTLFDVHSVFERVYIPSIDNTYKILNSFLEKL